MKIRCNVHEYLIFVNSKALKINDNESYKIWEKSIPGDCGCSLVFPTTELGATRSKVDRILRGKSDTLGGKLWLGIVTNS